MNWDTFGIAILLLIVVGFLEFLVVFNFPAPFNVTMIGLMIFGFAIFWWEVRKGRTRTY